MITMSPQGLPPFKVTSQPWFGPIARAREKLSARQNVLDPEETLVALVEILGDHAGSLQYARFIDFVKRPQNLRFTIVVLWVADHPDSRDAVYQCADALVERTGWYPLGQGSRLGSVRRRNRLHTAAPRDLPRLEGTFQWLESAVRPEDGCAVRVGLEGGASVLLDTGLPGRYEAVPSDELVFITHSHLDHAGGLISGRTGSLPVLMSSATAQILLEQQRLSRAELRERVVCLDPGQTLPLGPTIEAEAFLVPHSPGSTGFVLRDGKRTVVFTGDISLSTARYDGTGPLERVVAAEQGEVTLLLDATMAGRAAGASMAQPSPLALDSSEHRDLVVVGDSNDHLFYAYLDLFHNVQKSDRRHSRSFVLTGSIRPLARTVHSAFITREIGQIDPILAGQFGKSMSAWGESRWLYWLDRLSSRPIGSTIWFVTTDEVETVPAGPGTVVVYVGRAEAPMLPERLAWETLSADTTAWTSHSSEAALIEGVRRLQTHGNVVLFHNFPKRIRKFTQSNNLSAEALSGRVDLE